MRPRRTAARAARQGRDAKADAEREDVFRRFMDRAAAEMGATGARIWPPLTPEHAAELAAEDRADELLKANPHRFFPLYEQPRSICIICGRPRRSHFHYSRTTLEDVCRLVDPSLLPNTPPRRASR